MLCQVISAAPIATIMANSAQQQNSVLFNIIYYYYYLLIYLKLILYNLL
jgi:hypothetical protein